MKYERRRRRRLSTINNDYVIKIRHRPPLNLRPKHRRRRRVN